MADLFAQNTADWDAVNQWNTAANGSGSYVTPGASDRCMANNKTVTINIDVTVSEVSTAANGGTAGGGFTLANGVTLTATVTAGTTNCVTFAANAPAQAYIVGNGASPSATVSAAINTGTGTLTVNGTTWTCSFSSNSCYGLTNSSSGIINFTGTAISSNNGYHSTVLMNSSTGTFNVTGNILAPGSACRTAVNNSTGTVNVTGNPSTSNSGFGVYNNSTGTINITGNPSSSSSGYGAYNASSGTISITGNPSASSTGLGVYNHSTGTINITGNPSSSGIGHGAYNASSGTISITGNPSTSSTGLGVYNNSTGTINITGNPSSSSSGYGAHNNSTGTINVTLVGYMTGQSISTGGCVYNAAGGPINIIGDVEGGTKTHAIVNSATGGTIDISGSVRSGAGKQGYPAVVNYSTLNDVIISAMANDATHYNAPVQGRCAIRTPVVTQTYTFRDEDDGIVSLYQLSTLQADAPAAADVRYGTAYQVGAFTGTLRVPDPASVRRDVLTDDTVGTADLTAEDMWTYVTRTLTDSGSGALEATSQEIKTVVSNIANVAAPSYAAPTSYTLTTGNQTSGTFANVDSLNQVYHVHTDAASVLSLQYHFTLAEGEMASELFWSGRWNGTNDTLIFEIYDWTTLAWVQWFTQAGVSGSTSSSDIAKSVKLVAKYTGTNANIGKVNVRIRGTGLTSCTLSTDQLLCGKTSRTGGIANGAMVTLAGSNTNTNYIGANWNLAFGGGDISGCYFEGTAEITGVASGSSPVTFKDCIIGSGAAGATLPPGLYLRCGFNTTNGAAFMAASAGKYVFVDCFSHIAGAATPYFTFSGACSVMFRRYSGGANITLDNPGSVMSYETVGGGGLTCELAGADLEIRGFPRDITLTGIASTSAVRFVGITGPIALAGADGAVSIYGHCGVITDTRTGTPVTTNTAVSLIKLRAEMDAALSDLPIAQKLDGMLELDGALYRWTAHALSEGTSGGGGEVDWSVAERKQIRSALGIDGDKVAATGGQLQDLATAEAMAEAVRAELAVELMNLDAPVSGALTPAGTLARVTLVDTVTEVTNMAEVDLSSIEDDLEAILDRIAAQVPEGPVAVIPSAGANQTAAWCYCWDEHGARKAGVNIRVKLIVPGTAGTGSLGDSYSTLIAETDSNAEGVASVLLPRGALRFAVSRDGGQWIYFTGADAETLELPDTYGP